MLKPATPGTGITIGQLARTAGVNVETIRYYQRIRLLPLPTRDYGSIRRYSADDLKRVRFIKRAQALGFSLDEVALLLGLSDGRHCAETKTLAEKKLALVEEKISDLAAMRASLKGLVAECSKGSRGCGCPIIEALGVVGLGSDKLPLQNRRKADLKRKFPAETLEPAVAAARNTACPFQPA